MGDVGDHHPVARDVGPADLLDPRQRDPLDLAVLREVHLGPRGDLEAGDPAAAAAAAGAGQCGLHVLARDPSLAPRSLDPRQVQVQLTREPPHSGAGVDRTVGIRVRRRRRRRSAPAVAPVPPPRPRRSPAPRPRSPTRPAPPGSRSRRPQPARSSAITEPSETVSPTSTLSSTILPGERRGNVHRRLLGLERHERGVGADLVARLDQDLDHGDVGEVADVGDRGPRAARPSSRDRRIRSSRVDLVALDGLRRDRRLRRSPRRPALAGRRRATCRRSTSKKPRRWRR